MAYKLIKQAYGKPITGALLKELLTNEGFTVPAKVPMAAIPVPVRPTIVQGSSPAAVTEWNRYTIELTAYKSLSSALKADYFRQFTDFALRLAQEFVIVDAKTLEPSSGYSYKSAAAKLMGQYRTPPPFPIDFISFKNFG
jgi:hypothetical protein